jgi:cell division protease FtsH
MTIESISKTVLLWLIIGLLSLALFNLFQSSAPRSLANLTPYSEFIGQVNRGQVMEVTVQGRMIAYSLTDGRILSTHAMNDPGLVDRLMAKNVKFKSMPDEDAPTLLGILVGWFPMLLLIAVLIFFLRRIQAAVSQKTPEAKG